VGDPCCATVRFFDSCPSFFLLLSLIASSSPSPSNLLTYPYRAKSTHAIPFQVPSLECLVLIVTWSPPPPPRVVNGSARRKSRAKCPASLPLSLPLVFFPPRNSYCGPLISPLDTSFPRIFSLRRAGLKVIPCPLGSRGSGLPPSAPPSQICDGPSLSHLVG